MRTNKNNKAKQVLIAAMILGAAPGWAAQMPVAVDQAVQVNQNKVAQLFCQ